MTNKRPFVTGPKLEKKIRKYFEAVDIRASLYYEANLTSEKARELRKNALCLVDAFDELIKKTLIHEAPSTGWHEPITEYWSSGNNLAIEFEPAMFKPSWTPGLQTMTIKKYPDKNYYEMEITIQVASGMINIHNNFSLTSKNPDVLKQFMMLAAGKAKTWREWYDLADEELENE